MEQKLAAAAKKMQDKVADEIAAWLEGVTRDDFEKVAATHLSVDHVREKLDVVEKYLPGYLTPDKKILEIGCGFGAFTVYSRALYGYDTAGIEPDPTTYQYACELAQLSGVNCRIELCPGENLIFPDGTFDFVYSSNVLEHVQDPEKVLSESIRVLKPGGYLFFTYPNYSSFWEGHFAIPWFPFLNKPLAKLYVRLLGRNTAYIDTLQLVNVRYTHKILKLWADRVDVITLGDDLWAERMGNLKFGAWGLASRLKNILLLLHRFPFMVDLAIKMGKSLGWYYPIILVLRKK